MAPKNNPDQLSVEIGQWFRASASGKIAIFALVVIALGGLAERFSGLT